MSTILNVVGTVVSTPRAGKSSGDKPTIEFALRHRYVDGDGQIFDTSFYTILMNGNEEWARENALAKGDKVAVIGQRVTATAYKGANDSVGAVLNLRAAHCTRVDPESRDYLSGQVQGAVGADAEMRYGEGDNPKAYTNLRVGVDAGFQGANGWVDQTDWFNVSVIGRGADNDGNARAERAALIAKGDKIVAFIQNVKANAYVNKLGNLAASVDVVATGVRMVAKKNPGTASNFRPGAGAVDPDMLAAMGIVYEPPTATGEPATGSDADVDF